MSDQPRQPASAAEQSAELYLEDLFVGQRFTSGTYTMDEDLIKAFGTEFDPQPFHLDGGAAGIRRQRRCASGSQEGSRWAMELLAWEEI